MSLSGFDIGRTLLLILLIAVGGYVGVNILLYVFQSYLVYMPRRHLVATPADLGLPYQDVTFASADGVQLSGWWVPAPRSRGAVLFCHGNGGNISHYLEPVEMFHRLGLSTLVFDYRGYGQSAGSPTEEGTYLDAEAAWFYLVREQEVSPDRIIVCGRSLGGPIAAWLAQQHTPGGLLLEATFTSIPELSTTLYPLFPTRWLARYDYNTLGHLSRVTCPVLVVHSREDNLIPFSHGQGLYQAAGEPRAFLEIAGGHNDGFSLSAEPYQAALEEFVSSRLGLPRISE